MIITVQSIKPPPAGKDRSLVTTTDGQKFGARSNVAGMLQAGATYDVAIDEWEYNGKTYQNIKKAAPAAAPASPTPSSAAAPAAAFRTPKQMFVSETLVAYIASGRCEPQKLSEIVRFISKAWDANFGGASITGYPQAAE
jgi:hypothetical protein